MTEAYKKIVTHYENCLEQHGDNHLGMDWPNLEDALKRYRVMLDVIRFNNDTSKVTMLDFGCGTSHLYQYMLDNGFHSIVYSGLDYSTHFIDLAKTKYPNNAYFQADVLKEPNILTNYDYMVCNGVFTEKRELDFEAMWQYFQELMTLLFQKSSKGIAFNVMSKSVDWERWDLFHLPTDMLIDFMVKKLSRNFIIRNDYGLYEYTVYLYK